MRAKRFIAILSAAVLAAASLSACTGGKPVRSDVPELGNSVAEISAPEGATAAAAAPTSATKPAGNDGSQGKLVKEGNKAYYYVGDQLQTNGIVGTESEGLYYADEQGVIDLGYCDGINYQGVDWNIIEGVAHAVTNESDQTLHLALQAVAKFTDTSMSRDEKLRACFDRIKTDYLEGVRHDPPYQEIDWPVLYANDIFVYGKGDCFSYGAAFAYIGKAIGFEECYACNSGGHGWAKINGLYYDPEWDMHHNEYNHFGVAPEDECDVDYVDSLMDGVDWMCVKI